MTMLELGEQPLTPVPAMTTTSALMIATTASVG